MKQKNTFIKIFKTQIKQKRKTLKKGVEKRNLKNKRKKFKFLKKKTE
jgi:hypothetical protein